MVKTLLILLLPLCLFAAEISVEMSGKPVEALQPLEGTITIRHSSNEAVEAGSFLLGDEPLQVTPLGEESEGEQIVARFRFTVSAEEEGLQMLPPVSAVVGGKRIRAPGLAYQVKHQAPETALELRAFVYGERPFYPGERLQFVYKIYYRGEVQLTKEELPLIRAEGFRKIGSLEVDESEEFGYHVQSFIQRAEVLKEGEYAFPGSVIEGIINGGEKLRSEVAPFSLTVSPFPVKNQPLSFTGAVGPVALKAELKTPLPIDAGEILQLEVHVEGSNLQEVDFPNILCMPGFAGNFVLGGLPTAGLSTEEGKTFLVELRPLQTNLDAIPPLHFASYLPEKRAYDLLETKPIPIEIRAAPPVPFTPRRFVAKVDWEREKLAKLDLEKPSPTRIFSFWATWPALFLPLLWALLAYFRAPFQALFVRPKRRPSAAELVKAAERFDMQDPRFYSTLGKALQALPQEACERLKILLDQVRYGKKEIDKEALLKAFREA